MPPIALTIAGSDSIAGAGVQADLKTFEALGVYGVTAVTAITSQNTTGVSEIYVLPAATVAAQLRQVCADVTVSAVKTGMLAAADIVEVVAEEIGSLAPGAVVVDPVMGAGADSRTLLTPEGVSRLKTRLLPLATVVTPNVSEACVLAGIPVGSLTEAREAARRIADLGVKAVVIKGGHLYGQDAVDVLYCAGTFDELAAPRWTGGPVHGTGCAFASALAARLALGDDIPAAASTAKAYVTGAIAHSVAIGAGSRVLDHFWRRHS